MKARHRFLVPGALLACCLCAALPRAGRAQTAGGKNVIEEADARFSKGVEFFNEGDYTAALAEFLWAYNLKPHFAVLYNIGVCYLEGKRYIEALDYFEKYLKEAGDKAQKDRKKEVGEEIARIKSILGSITVKTNIDHVKVIVDGKEAGKTPLAGPVFVSPGTHTIELGIAEYAPQKDEVTIASGVNLVKSYTMVKDKRTSKITVVSGAPHAKLFVDDREMGTLPWSGQLAVGEHQLKVVAPGYRDALRPIMVLPDEEREIEVELDIAGDYGKLTISSPVQGAAVWLEGGEIGAIPLKSYKLPAGIYRVGIAKEGYKGWEGDVSIREGGVTKVSVKLDKTEGKLHPWLFSLATALTVASGAAGIALGYVALQKEDELDTYLAEVESGSQGANSFRIWDKYEKTRSEGKRLSIAADVCFALTGVAGITMIFVGVFTRFKKPESTATVTIGALGQPSIGATWSF